MPIVSAVYHPHSPEPNGRKQPRHIVRNCPAASGWEIVNVGHKFVGPCWLVQRLPGCDLLTSDAEAVDRARQANVPCTDQGVVPSAWYKTYYYQQKKPVQGRQARQSRHSIAHTG